MSLLSQKHLLSFVFVLSVASLLLSGCRSPRRTAEPDRISKHFELYMEQVADNNYDEFSEKVGYTLNGDENPDLLREIISWIGTPYLYGGTTRRGADCSGFVQSVYRTVYGINLDRSTSDMVNNGRRINSKSRLREGDLVFFRITGRRISHVGIYISNDYFAHASSSRGVVVDNLNQRYYADRFAFGGRVLR